MIRLIVIFTCTLMLLVVSCQGQNKTGATVPVAKWTGEIPEKVEKIEKGEDEWKSELTKMEYYVLREKGTERSFTGDLLKIKDEGLYVCRGCGLPLFASSTKFKSGTGWPSFYEPLKSEFIQEDTDYNTGYARTEVMCARCDGHLGHVFPDGPKPTGLRYCINAVSLDFVAQEKPE